MAPDSPAIEVMDVAKAFGDARALDGVSVAIRENEFFTLLGPSGCGKTTLLRLIAGFDFPTAGEIRLHGQDIAGQPPFARPVNTVFQSYALFPHMTVEQNIGFGLKMLGKPRAQIAERVNQMLALVRMESFRTRRTSQLSGGQQQRVALARALAPAPRVLLLDEPLSALDYKLRKEMQGELKRLQTETGITFIFVTHDQEEALTMSDRIAVMSGGRILQVGTPRDIYDHPRTRFVADFIGEVNFLAATLAATDGTTARVRLAAGGEVKAGLPDAPPPPGPVTVIVRPEHAELRAPDQSADLRGTLEQVVYFGTDTHLYVRLNDGAEFVLRQQNSPGGNFGLAPGAGVGIAFKPGAARVLKD
jgi:spermidine/putrescine transport system ATP-binding protein